MKKDKQSILIETDHGSIFWLDVLRVFATVAVVFLHVSAEVVTSITDTASFSWWAANLYDSVVRWAVPVFVMISGALLLGHSHQESLAQFYRKRSNRIIIPLVFWTAAYFAFVSHCYGQIELKSALISIALGKPYWHLWYLYMLVGLYIVTPFLRTYVASSSIKERYALIIVIFTFAALNSALNYFVFNNIISDMQTVFTMFVPYVGYYICGYQFRVIDNAKISSILLLFLILECFIAGFLGTGLVANSYGLLKGLFFYDYFSPAVICLAVCIFLLFSRIFSLDGSIKIFRGFIEQASPCTMGIYLLHPMVIGYLRAEHNLTAVSMNPAFSIPIYSLSIFLFCFAVMAAVTRIPLLKRIV